MSGQLSDVLLYARKLAKTDTNGRPDADGINYATDAQRELQLRMIKNHKDLFNQDSYRDITATEIVGGASPGRFLLPTDCFTVKAIRINLVDPTNPSYYKKPDQVDLSNLPEGITWEWLKVNQPVDQPLILWHGSWFEIAPTPTVVITSGLFLSYFLGPTDFVATTDFIQYPYSLNQNVLANKITELWYKSYQDFDSATPFGEKADQLLQDIEDAIGAGSQTNPEAKDSGDTGWNY